MPLTDKNQLLIAYKKLLGKTHTASTQGINNESLPSSIQMASSMIFGQTIPETPDPTDTSVVKKVTLDLVAIPLSSYDIKEEYGIGVSGTHGFRLALQSSEIGYDIGTFIDSHKNLQLVPSNFGSVYSPVLKADGVPESPIGSLQWIVDCYSGVLFVQNLDSTNPNGYPGDGKNWTVDAYIYTGQYLDEAVAAAAANGPSPEVIESAEGTGDSIDARAGIRFEDEPESLPTPDYAAAMLYYEGELQFYTNQIAEGSQYEILHLSRNGIVTANSITAFGNNTSIQFNDGGIIAGSDVNNLSWNNTTNTLSVTNVNATNVNATNIDTTSINTSDIVTNTISATTVTISGEGTLPAAGADTQIQYNNAGNLGASEKLSFEQSGDIFSLKVIDSANNNSAKLFVNVSETTATNTSGLLLSNDVNNLIKDFKIDNQYDNTTAIYKIDSDLPLYINSYTQNLLTAGSSKIDMSAGKVEIWPNSSDYVKIGTESGTLKTNLLDFKLGVQENNTDYALLRYNIPDQQYIGGELEIYLANEVLPSFSLNSFGLNLPNYLAVGSSNANGLASFYFNGNNGGSSSTLNLANFSNFSNEYANIQYKRDNNKGKLSFAIESTTPQVEIDNSGIYSDGCALSTVQHVLMENDFVRYYDDSNLTVVAARSEILRTNILSNRKYAIDVEIFFSYQTGQIFIQNSEGISVSPFNLFVNFAFPDIRIEICERSNNLSSIATGTIFNQYTLFSDKISKHQSLTLNDGSLATFRSSLQYYNPYPRNSLRIYENIEWAEENPIGTSPYMKIYEYDDLETIPDYVYCTVCKFIIDLADYSSDVDLVLASYENSDRRLTNSSGQTPLTQQEEQDFVDNNVANSPVPNTLNYSSGFSSGYSINKGSNIKITRIS